jgi:sialate O-acetylesterase
MSKKVNNLIGVICIVFLTNSAVFGALKLPAIFGDNMILQRNMKVPIWGWADPGSIISITFKSKTFKTIADENGKWSTKLASYKEGGPYEMLISAQKEILTIKNILIGDIWIASGQSNMEFGIQLERNGKEAIAKANDTLIRFFSVPVSFSLQPKSDIARAPGDSLNGRWVVCSPSLMGNPKWAYRGFSSVAYYFAQQIRQTTGSPVGLVGSYVGGTPAQNWLSINEQQQHKNFSHYLLKHQELVDHYDSAKATYPRLLATYRETLAKWNEEVGKNYNIQKKQWDTAVIQARATGQNPPVQPRPSRPAPQSPVTPEGGFRSPFTLYNAMIAPIVPYGIKGAIWYQGESNGDKLADAVEYRELFPLLIEDWRNNWNQGKFPFLFVQLANYKDPAVTPSEGNWPWVREAQLKALSLPKTGMAVITDLGEANNIHPTNKKDVGLRLSLAARKLAYEEDVVYSGPLFKSMKIEKNKIRIKFTSIGTGLKAGLPPQLSTINLKGFGIAGEDHVFKWATTVIEGNTIVVFADEVPVPLAVRYNWGDNPAGNLYNKEGLPASSFRTDDWSPFISPVK